MQPILTKWNPILCIKTHFDYCLLVSRQLLKQFNTKMGHLNSDEMDNMDYRLVQQTALAVLTVSVLTVMTVGVLVVLAVGVLTISVMTVFVLAVLTAKIWCADIWCADSLSADSADTLFVDSADS